MILPESGTILDGRLWICAVGIAAATFNPHLHVVMTDINSRAVQLARYNCEKKQSQEL